MKNERAALLSPETLSLMGILAIRRIAGAAFPVAMFIAVASVRGIGEAALLQGFRVAVATFTAPLRARLIDRFGRARVVIIQTLVSGVGLISFVFLALQAAVPLVYALGACLITAATAPAMDSVVRAMWKEIATEDKDVKRLHSADSIIEETGYLLGPVLVSGLALAAGGQTTVYVTTALLIVGSVIIFVPPHIRRGLYRAPLKPSAAQAPAKPAKWTLTKSLKIVLGPIALPPLQRIVAPLIYMGISLGILGVLIPAVSSDAGNIAWSGFAFGAISLGGLIGAFAYGSIQLKRTLRTRHAMLALLFACPLLLIAFSTNLWLIGAVLVVSGLAVTPLYINAYLMMDEDLPPEIEHEANTWVPVGNNVGYTIGIVIAGTLAATPGHLPWIAFLLVATAAVTSAYGILQLVKQSKSTRSARLGRSSSLSKESV